MFAVWPAGLVGEVLNNDAMQIVRFGNRIENIPDAYSECPLNNT